MLDCIFVGSVTQDSLLLVEEPPASDRRIAATAAVRACGGVAGTAAVAFQKLGGRAGLITAIGRESDITTFLRQNLQSWKLPFLQMISMENADSPFSAIQVEKNGKRCITHFGGCIRQLTLEQMDLTALERTGMIHLGGLEERFAVELARYCKEYTKLLVSVDGGNLSRAATDAILPYTDLFIPDDKTVEKTLGLSPKEACKYYIKQGAMIACVTLGDQGCIACRDGKFFTAEPVSVPVVDTTGAGDNFHGAFLYCLLRYFSMEKTLRFCNTFSALTCRGLGGQTAQPTLEETLSKMAEEKR